MPPIRDSFESTTWGSSRSHSGHTLADICAEGFYLIFHMREGNDPGHPDSLRKEIALLFKDMERRGGKRGYGEEDLKAARYALCALIDETILNSQWAFKDQWADKPLQLEYFGEHMAGERFFDLLERIRQKGSRKADLLEIFCLSLILGFQGKFKMQGAEQLNILISELIQEIHSHRGSPRTLSPNWKIPKEPREKSAALVPQWVWITAASSLLLVIIVFAIFWIWLGSSADDAVSRMIF